MPKPTYGPISQNGGKRAGAGRKPGVPNKVNKAIREMVEKGGETPKAFLLKIMRDEAKDEDVRIEVAKSLLPYTEHRLATIEHTGKGGGPIQMMDLTKLTDAQLEALEPVIAELASASDIAGADPEGEGPPPT